jgi:hypothetical protein
LEKLRDFLIGALGGLLSGAVASTFVQSLILQLFGYQEGWYRQFAPFFAVPLLVLGFYVAALVGSQSRRRFVIAFVLIVPVVVIFLVSRAYLPISARYAWIEFTSFWTIVAQFAGILLCTSWRLFWTAYDRMSMASTNKP